MRSPVSDFVHELQSGKAPVDNRSPFSSMKLKRAKSIRRHMSSSMSSNSLSSISESLALSRGMVKFPNASFQFSLPHQRFAAQVQSTHIRFRTANVISNHAAE